MVCRLKLSSFGVFVGSASAAASLFIPKKTDSDKARAAQVGSPPATAASLPKLKLFTSVLCPQSSKVATFLHYYGMKYEAVEVNPVTKKQLIGLKLPPLFEKHIPVLNFGPEPSDNLTESSTIISVLRTWTLNPARSLGEVLNFYPAVAVLNHKDETVALIKNKYFVMFEESLKDKEAINLRREEREWREWTDDVLIPTLTANLFRSYTETLGAYHVYGERGHWRECFSFSQRLIAIYVGALIAWWNADSIKNSLRLKPDVRQSLYDIVNDWMRAIGPSRLFLGGNEPNLADLAVYGVLCSAEPFSVIADLNEENRRFARWYAATKVAVNRKEGRKTWTEFNS